MSKVGKLLVSWDSTDIIQGQADWLKETGDYPGKTDAELFEMACDDPDLFESNWKWLCDELTAHIAKNKHGGWKVDVHNFGWRSLNGHKYFTATNGRELLQAVLPKTDNTFKVYRYGRGLAINNAHHDSPVWEEWYYITSCKQVLRRD
jgi:hypothetical protein